MLNLSSGSFVGTFNQINTTLLKGSCPFAHIPFVFCLWQLKHETGPFVLHPVQTMHTELFSSEEKKVWMCGNNKRVCSLSREAALLRRCLDGLQWISVIVNVQWFIFLVSHFLPVVRTKMGFSFFLYNIEERVRRADTDGRTWHGLVTNKKDQPWDLACHHSLWRVQPPELAWQWDSD